MTISAPSAPPSMFAVFRHRNFALLSLSQFISTMGTGLTTLATSLLIYRETSSALGVGLILMATALPTLFVGLFAGVIVDRYDRKRIMIAADLVRAILVLVIPWLLPLNIVWMYLFVAISSGVAQFYEPAQASLLPETAHEDELAAANSMLTVVQVGALTLGYISAGLIASLGPIEWAFYVNALTFAASALCLVFMRITPLAASDDTNLAAVGENLRTGLSFVRDRAVLRSLFLIFIPISIMAGVDSTLMLPFSTQRLSATEFDYSLLEGLFTVGYAVGSLAMARVADRLHEGQWIAMSIAGTGLMNAAFGLMDTVPGGIVFMCLYGIMNAPSYVGYSLIIQRHTPRDVRGRVSSAFFITRDLTYMVGMVVGGLADVLDVRLLVLGSGILTMICGLVASRLSGLGQPTAEWLRMLTMLRTAPAAPGLGLGRAALLSDINLLARRLPLFADFDLRERQKLAEQTRVYDVAAGTAIVRQGEASDAAYILLEGSTVASRTEGEDTRVLEVHNPGDFFGEIAALTGAQRTASVLVDQDAQVLQVPVATLRELMRLPEINRAFTSKLTERMVRMGLMDLPRIAGMDQELLRELRTPRRPQTDTPAA